MPFAVTAALSRRDRCRCARQRRVIRGRGAGRRLSLGPNRNGVQSWRRTARITERLAAVRVSWLRPAQSSIRHTLTQRPQPGTADWRKGQGGVERDCQVGRRRPVNPLYALRNNWHTLTVGLAHVPADENVVIVNSDLVGGDSILERFLQAAAMMRSDGLLAVDGNRPLTGETIKVAARPLGGADLALTAIGKTNVANPMGEYIGIAAVRASTVPKLAAVLTAHELDESMHDRWYDLAFGDLATAGADIRIWRTGSSCWVEVDDAEDLRAAQTGPPRGASR